jgi:hypothetical protein
MKMGIRLGWCKELKITTTTTTTKKLILIYILGWGREENEAIS